MSRELPSVPVSLIFYAFEFTLYFNKFLLYPNSLLSYLRPYQASQVRLPIEGVLKGLCLSLSKAIEALLANTRNFFQSYQLYDTDSNNGISGDDSDDYEMK